MLVMNRTYEQRFSSSENGRISPKGKLPHMNNLDLLVRVYDTESYNFLRFSRLIAVYIIIDTYFVGFF